MSNIGAPPITMSALDFIDDWMRPAIPMSVEQPCNEATRSEVRRWLDQKAVIINSQKPAAKDKVYFPVTSLIFFPKSKERRCTVI